MRLRFQKGDWLAVAVPLVLAVVVFLAFLPGEMADVPVAEIYLDGEYLGVAPMDFEKIIGSYVITVIRSDGAVKNFNCSETDNGNDSYYNFSWID